jgi:hypothetical protein
METVTYNGELFVNERRMKNNNIGTGVWYYFDKNGKRRELNNWNLIHICDKLLIGEKPITKEKDMKDLEKPTKEKFGWLDSNGFDGEPSGWQFEGGEEAYYKAVDEWSLSQINKTAE